MEIKKYGHSAILDLLNTTQIKDEITIEIWKNLSVLIDDQNTLTGDQNQLLKLFSDRFEVFKKQVLVSLDSSSSDYNNHLIQFITTTKNDLKYCCERLSLNWKNRKKGLIIVLDNLDQLPFELQRICVLTAAEISHKLSCLVIMSLREERYFNLKDKGVLDAYHTSGYHLPSPVITDVIIKRLAYILEELKFSEDYQKDMGISSLIHLNAIIDFFEICIKELKRKGSALSSFLRNTTHGDVRQSLEYFKGFITSGYTNINEVIAVGKTWKFQIHQVLKPMMIPSRFFYSEKVSRIPNLFQIRSESNGSHFTGLRILDKLRKKSHDKASAGFVDAKFLVQNFEYSYNLKEDCEIYLDIFLAKGLIESSNRMESYDQKVDQIRITAFGQYAVDYLFTEFTYLDLVCLDCGLMDEKLNNHLVRSAHEELKNYYNRDFMSRIKVRLDKVEEFVKYLVIQENKDFSELRLPESEPSFSKKIKKSFEIEKKLVLSSAIRKKSREF